MAVSKPSIPKGTRDYSPQEMAKRNYIFDTIRGIFKLFGYLSIETPAMENLSTLMGKYGEEGDKLLFKILNSGNFLKDIPESMLTEENTNALIVKLCEKGLRYDLTVPFARYVVQHRNEITFPFKRYQIQPVWRADRPQKGRYREFFQCDIDVIGSKSLLNEAELIQIVDAVYLALKINVLIKINNRKILNGIAEVIGESDRLIDITVAIDKIDKIGLDAVKQELSGKGVSEKAIEQLQPILTISGTTNEKLDKLREVLTPSPTGMQGIDELHTIFGYIDAMKIEQEIELDLSLARGLNYYTGAILEVKAKDVEIGSITGGGRYDDLTGVFGLKDVSGVGISFGADRIYDVLTTLNLFPESTNKSTQVLFANLGKAEERYCLPVISRLREQGIAVELYPDKVKLGKQFEYADKRAIAFVVIVGENEMQKGMLTLKNMKDGTQEEMNINQIITKFT
ncbi:MAG: histidine--tRNA ligase [Prevotellaceae bacterium]|jgi:histidyl-tRNA synthetase|nr:histidine--tRNA ligase [Prevotellaceae bacterium]